MPMSWEGHIRGGDAHLPGERRSPLEYSKQSSRRVSNAVLRLDEFSESAFLRGNLRPQQPEEPLPDDRLFRVHAAARRAVREILPHRTASPDEEAPRGLRGVHRRLPVPVRDRKTDARIS